jgi:serine/threonine protein kinase
MTGSLYAGSDGYLNGQHVLIEDRIGSGSQASVYRARFAEYPGSMAMRITADRPRHPPIDFSRIPHTPPMFTEGDRRPGSAGTLAPPGRHAQAFELVTGRTLGEHLSQHAPLSIQQGISILVQAAKCLEAVHEQGVVHRDLSYNNVLYDEREDAAFVIDWGLAGWTGQGTGSQYGTPDVMAPEQARAEPAQPAMDVYALAA